MPHFPLISLSTATLRILLQIDMGVWEFICWHGNCLWSLKLNIAHLQQQRAQKQMPVFLGADTLKIRPKHKQLRHGIWQKRLLFMLAAYSEWISACNKSWMDLNDKLYIIILYDMLCIRLQLLTLFLSPILCSSGWQCIWSFPPELLLAESWGLLS